MRTCMHREVSVEVVHAHALLRYGPKQQSFVPPGPGGWSPNCKSASMLAEHVAGISKRVVSGPHTMWNGNTDLLALVKLQLMAAP